MPFGIPNPISAAKNAGSDIASAAKSAARGTVGMAEDIGSSFGSAFGTRQNAARTLIGESALLNKGLKATGIPGAAPVGNFLFGNSLKATGEGLQQGGVRGAAKSALGAGGFLLTAYSAPGLASAAKDLGAAAAERALPRAAEELGAVRVGSPVAKSGLATSARDLAPNIAGKAKAAARAAEEVPTEAKAAGAAVRSLAPSARDLAPSARDLAASAKTVATKAARMAATKTANTTVQDVITNPSTGEVFSAGEREASGLVAKAAAKGAAAASKTKTAAKAVPAAEKVAQEAPAAAEEAVKGGRIASFAKTAGRKAAGALNPVTAAKRVGEGTAELGGAAKKAATLHPMQAAGKAISGITHISEGGVTLGAEAGAIAGVRGSNTKLGAGLRAVTGGGQPFKDVEGLTKSQAQTNASNMGQSLSDYEGIKAVYAKYGQAGLKALVGGLKKTRQDIPDFDKLMGTKTMAPNSSTAVRQRQALATLKQNVKTSPRLRR